VATKYEANKIEDGRMELVQTTYFAPKGLFGLIYWYAVYPFHVAIYSRMIDAVVHRVIYCA